MTWGIVVYPAWDEWTEADPAVRAAVEEWLAGWVTAGPPTDAEQLSRVIEATGTELSYIQATHPTMGVVATFITGMTGDRPYAAILQLRSPRQPDPGRGR